MSTEGQCGFLRRAVRAADDSVMRKAGAASDNGAVNSLVSALKKEEQVVHVDIGEELKRACLSQLPDAAWPSSALCDDIATKAKALLKKGIAHPFVFVDLRKALPSWAAYSTRDDVSDDEGADSCALRSIAKALGATDKPKPKHLTFLQWVAAYQRYALAAQVTGQMNYTSAMVHFENCLRVGEEAKAKGSLIALAACYDSVARREWADMAAKGVPGFDINKLACRHSEDLLRMAEREFASNAAAPKPAQRWERWDQHESDHGSTTRAYGHEAGGKRHAQQQRYGDAKRQR